LIFPTVFTRLLDVLLQEYEEFRTRSIGELAKINPMMMTRQFRRRWYPRSNIRKRATLRRWPGMLGQNSVTSRSRVSFLFLRFSSRPMHLSLLEILSSISDRCRSAKR